MSLDTIYQRWSADRSQENVNDLMAATKDAIEQQLRWSTSLDDVDNLDDAVQRTLIRVWEHLPEFEPNPEIEDAFSRWVSATAGFSSLSERRDRAIRWKRQKSFSDLGCSEGLDDDTCEYDVNELPPDMHELLRLAQLGYTMEESAKRQGITHATLRKRLERFRKARAAALMPHKPY